MHTKTMEGLIGARTNMNLMNTPMRVYKEARRNGDSGTMERAMRYVGECSDRAEKYKAEADEGMKKDAEETRKIAKEQREEAIQKRRDEREKLAKKIEENRNGDANTDTKETKASLLETRACRKETRACRKETRACLLEISEEGKALLKDSTGLDDTISAEQSTSISASV